MGLERRDGYWLWVGGPVPPGSSAITIWKVVSVRRSAAGSPGLIHHEEVHVRQWHELGPVGFLRRYLGSYLTSRWRGYGHKAAYRLIPLEIEAYEAQRRFVEEQEDTEGTGGTGDQHLT